MLATLAVGAPIDSLADRLHRLLAGHDLPEAERDPLVRLMVLLAQLPAPPDPFGLMPRYGELADAFRERTEGDDPEALEESFLALYAHLHGHEAPYTPAERRRVDDTGGYWCHAGGLSPILKAGPHLGPNSVSADFGAGNGLQCLLMQKLYPHAQTVQLEISSRMIEAGEHLQAWLEVPQDRVRWVATDVCDASPAGFDLVYLYRPVRPDGPGRRFYERFARDLQATPTTRSVVIFSIADALRPFLKDTFEVFYGDGHLTCFRGPIRRP